MSSALPHATYERFESRREYEAMFDELIPAARQTIRIFDHALGPSFNAPERCERLAQFLRTGEANRIYVVVHETRGAEQTCARFLSLLQRFSHVAKVRQSPRWAREMHDRFAVFDEVCYLRCFHHEHARFARGRNDLEGTQPLLERFNELWDASQSVFSASVLGL